MSLSAFLTLRANVTSCLMCLLPCFLLWWVAPSNYKELSLVSVVFIGYFVATMGEVTNIGSMWKSA